MRNIAASLRDDEQRAELALIERLDRRFAEETGLHRKTVGAVLHGRARVTAKTAVRFFRALDTTPEFRLTLHNAVDIFEARRKLAAFA